MLRLFTHLESWTSVRLSLSTDSESDSEHQTSADLISGGSFAVRYVRGWQGSLCTNFKTNSWKLSHSLSLLIVLRYSTVVVLVVEVVVVVLEVVSASSQQRPVTQSVSPVVVVQHFSLFWPTDWLTDCPSLPYSSVMSRWGLICLIMRLLDITKKKKDKKKMYKKKN